MELSRKRTFWQENSKCKGPVVEVARYAQRMVVRLVRGSPMREGKVVEAGVGQVARCSVRESLAGYAQDLSTLGASGRF